MIVNFDDKQFMSDMMNLVEYSSGYLDGIQLGKPEMLKSLGKNIKVLLEEFVDVNARIDPASLHHVYEWYQAGSPEARLFNISVETTNGGLTFNSQFTQSKTFSHGSNKAFYDKAQIMENGIPVVIKPSANGVLSFDDNGEQVFTKKEILIENPGGKQVQGSYANTLQNFFENYLRQSYLSSSGFTQYLQDTSFFKNNLPKFRGGRSAGREIGYNWIVKAGNEL